MNQFTEIILIYLFGGLTFIPILLVILYFSSPSSTTLPSANNKEEEKCNNPYAQQGKKGWIRLTKRYKPKGSSESNVAVLMSGIQSYVQGSKRQKEHVYAELKCGALFIYESDQPHEECKIIIPIHNYAVSIYPEKRQDHDIFGRSIALRLVPKKTDGDSNNMEILLKGGDASSPYLTSNNELYITCARPVDKEDWYFGLLAATEMMSESPNHVEMMDITHFDASAMQTLISTVQQDAEYREVQWLNAILGRLFLGMYKTDEMRQYFQEKISKKTQKIKRPSFLGDISVQSVDIGNSIPFVTQPKLLSLTPEGDLMAEATVHYAGGLRVVIQTDFNWTYSSLMKPIRVPLVLSVTLKRLSGKFLLKVKPPPTNRYWIGFYEMPVMDWEITPIVSDKQIRLSMVTNAIQSKIREFMMENIVLPNMDDFPFCPSGGKGGIFGERVPKPSSPKETFSGSSPILSSGTAMNLDMLGNKVNQTKVPPKVIVTNHQDSFDILQQALPKPPTRRAESLGVLDSSMLADQSIKNRRSKSTSPYDTQHLAAVSILRSRGYSNPDILLRPNQNDDDHNNKQSPNDIEEENEAVSPEVVYATPSFTRRLSSNIVGFRKRQQQEVVVVEEDLPDEPESYFPLDTTNKKEVLLTTTSIVEERITATVQVEQQRQQQQQREVEVQKEEAIIQRPLLQHATTSTLEKREFDDTSSILSTKSSSTNSNKINLLSKLTNNVNKITSSTNTIKMTNKKQALYNMAGNIFNKKAAKVTKEMKDERNRELQESHNRKMMNLFINNEPPKQSPPSLPPRRMPVSSLSSLSSDEDEEEASSPTTGLLQQEEVSSLKQQSEEVIIVNQQHQQHGLSL